MPISLKYAFTNNPSSTYYIYSLKKKIEIDSLVNKEE